MTKFESDFFQKINFTPFQVNKYLTAAHHDLQIAKQSNLPEVIFDFSYKAFIRYGIALIAEKGYKVRSNLGHHFKIIEKMSEILSNEEIMTYGNRMRQMRNFNFYDEGTIISEKDAKEYLSFVGGIITRSK